MFICSRCGDGIDYKYVNGSCIPLHRSGRCGGALPITTYYDYKISDDSSCFSTKCPECNEEVYFIKHNGGNVWIDPPLGPPWYKHSCFGDNCDRSVTKDTLCSEYHLSNCSADDECTLNVVVLVDVSFYKKSTKVYIFTGKDTGHYLLLSGNAGYLLGKLCIYNSNDRVIYPIDNPHLLYRVAADILDGGDPQASRKEAVCPECGDVVMLDDIKSHLGKHLYLSQIRGR